MGRIVPGVGDGGHQTAVGASPTVQAAQTLAEVGRDKGHGLHAPAGGGTRLKPFGGRWCSAVVIAPPRHFHGVGNAYEERPRRGGDHARPEAEKQRGQEEAPAHGEIPG